MSSSAPGATATSAVRHEIVRFVAVTLLALVVVVGVSTVVAHAISRDVAVREAKGRGLAFARTVSAPLVDGDVRAGNPVAVDAFDRIMRTRLRDGSVVHIRIWERGGRVLWADQPEAVGQSFELEPQAVDLFDHAGAVGWLDDGHDAEHRLVRGEGELLEVYASGTTAEGDRVVVETYWPSTGLAAVSGRVMQRLLPLTLGTLLVFALPVLGLSVGLARRVDRAHAANAELWQQSLAASELERRRIAADLHDGVLQDVAAARYAVEALGLVAPDRPAQATALADQAAQLVARVGEGVRSTLVDIYPAALHAGDVEAALQDVVRPLRSDGVVVCTDVADLSHEAPEVRQLVYRVAREALSNARKHAAAQHVSVVVSVEPDLVSLDVTDDGLGLPLGPAPDDHFGLRLVQDLARGAGGSVVLGPSSTGGARVHLELPRPARHLSRRGVRDRPKKAAGPWAPRAEVGG